ncbi:MAG: hypothetical protein L0Y57_03540 [Beijerinckiaceae bacterium]|nr:hypothetical protein [Beijerinckiaceae bacterium]
MTGATCAEKSIHLIANIFGETDSILSRTRGFARAGEAGAITRSLQRAFLRTSYGILDRSDSLAKLAAKR